MRRKLRSEILEALQERLVVMQRVEIRGDTIVTRWRVSGRNDAGVPALGLPPNGKRVDVTVYTVDRVNGSDVLRTVYLDVTALSRQLADDGIEDARSA
jgi:predicted ester cyclase